MGSSESTGRSNGGENEEEERPTENNRFDITSSIGAAAVAIGTVAVAAWGVSRMLSDENNRSDITCSIGAAAVAIGTIAVAAWGVSRMLSDENNSDHKSRQVKDEMIGAFRSLGSDYGGTSSAPPRQFKLKTDGACHSNHADEDGVSQGPSGYAGILEDDCGNLVRGFRGFIGVSNCFTAEIHGVLKGLELLDKLGYKGSVLENDFEEAVGWVSGEDDGPGKSRVVRDCWDLINKSRQLVRRNNITVRHCYRNANKHADKLAGIAIKKGEAYVEFTDVYDEINSL